MKTGKPVDADLPALKKSIDGDRIVAVSDRRHVAVDAVLFAPLDELPANLRIFILVFDQRAALAQARCWSFAVVARARIVEGRRILAAAQTKRHPACPPPAPPRPPPPRRPQKPATPPHAGPPHNQTGKQHA